MKFHPVISILLGIMAAITIFGITTLAFNVTLWTMLVAVPASLIIGGFIATYFTKEKKRVYSVYVGAIIAVFMVISFGRSLEYDVIAYNLLLIVFIPLITSIGGYIGKRDPNETEFEIDKYFKGS